MKDINKHNNSFDNSFRRKMDEAGYTPSERVWSGIEGELLRLENRRIKRKAAIYRNIAAAVFLLALGLFYFNISKESVFTSNQSKSGTLIESLEIGDNNYQAGVIPAKPNAGKPDFSAKKIDKTFIRSTGIKENRDISNSKNIIASTKDVESTIASNSIDRIAAIAIENNSAITTPSIQPSSVDYFAVSEIKQNTSSSNAIAFNTGLNFGSGSFNPNSEITGATVEPTFSSLNYPGAAGRGGQSENLDNFKERQSLQDIGDAPVRSNVSLTAGVNVGLKIGERWNIRSGIQYGIYKSSSESNAVVRDFNKDELYPFHGASSANRVNDDRVLNVTSEYEIYNDFEIISVPLMLTYAVLNKKFKAGIVGGIATDLFLSNTIKGGSEQITDVNYSKEDNQPYRNLFLSGLVGVELSYELSNNYSISLIPTYKKAFNSITEDDANFSSTPSYGSINMSVNYLF